MESNFSFRKTMPYLAGLLFILLVYSWYTSRRTLPNIYFAGEDVGNMTRQELELVVESRVDTFKSAAMVIGVRDSAGRDVAISTSADDLGIGIDSQSSIDEIFTVGKSGNFPEDLLAKSQLIFGRNDIPPVYNIDYQLFSAKIFGLLSGHYTPARDATVIFDNRLQIVPDEPGQKLNFARLSSDLLNRVETLSNEPILVEFIREDPKVSSEGAARALDKIKLLANQRIILVYGSDSWQLSGQNLMDIVKFSPKGLAGGYVNRLEVLGDPVEIRALRTTETKPLELDLSLDDQGIDSFVDKIAKSVDQETVDATISFDGEKVSQFTPARDGQKLDGQLTKAAVREKVSVDNSSPDKIIAINLPVEVTRARIANDQINSLGIKELIGRGVSYFAGSIPNRVHNLTLGSKRVGGSIVKPGETFSFNKSVGDVSGATGYKQAYVISSGRTILDDGGGICQVSTTIFRAALNSGLPIVSRTAHAYRVGYYEQHGFKAGYDATVWAPAVDLVFKNDTDHHVLIQAVVDTYDSRLQVDIYGTNDGRVVELGQPVLSNIKPAPEAKYQDDPSLPRGTVKQADFAAQGATSVFTRKVYKGNRVIIDDTFKSVYRPWQAVYLVGTM